MKNMIIFVVLVLQMSLFLSGSTIITPTSSFLSVCVSKFNTCLGFLNCLKCLDFGFVFILAENND